MSNPTERSGEAVQRPTLKTEPYSLGRFAVMRHSSVAKRAHFMTLHDSYGAASKEAVRLLAAVAGDLQHTFYVLEIVGYFSAGPDGLKSEEKAC